MAIWFFKCTNDSRQSFTLRTWLVQSAFSSSFQRASACSGGKNQFRLGQTWMKIRQKTMQNSWFYMCYQCLQATLLPSYSWISCQVSQNVRLGQETNLLLTCQNLSQLSLNILHYLAKWLVSVYSPSNPGASKPNNPSSNKLITVEHRDIFQGICGMCGMCGICIFLICTILDLGRSKNQWQGAQETEPTVCGTAELPAMPSFRDLKELCPWPAWQPALEGTSQNRGIIRVMQQLNTFLRILRCDLLWFQDICRFIAHPLYFKHCTQRIARGLIFPLGVGLHIDRWRSRQGLKEVPQCKTSY